MTAPEPRHTTTHCATARRSAAVAALLTTTWTSTSPRDLHTVAFALRLLARSLPGHEPLTNQLRTAYRETARAAKTLSPTVTADAGHADAALDAMYDLLSLTRCSCNDNENAVLESTMLRLIIADTATGLTTLAQPPCPVASTVHLLRAASALTIGSNRR